MTTNIIQRVILDGTRETTPEGYLKAKATLTKVGIQQYQDFQNADKTVKVFRPAETVFHKDTKASLQMKPITDGHPPVEVNPNNIKKYQVGSIGDSSQSVNGDALGLNIIVTDKKVIQKIKDGTVELSAGYRAKLAKSEGFYDNQKYDYKFDGAMEINHLALVDAGRCGNEVCVFDSVEGGLKMIDKEKFDKEAKTDNNEIMSDIKTKQDSTAEKTEVKTEVKTEDSKIQANDSKVQEINIVKIKDELRREISDSLKSEYIERAKIVSDALIINKKFQDNTEQSVKDLLIELCDSFVSDAKNESVDFLKGSLRANAMAIKDGANRYQSFRDSQGSRINDSSVPRNLLGLIEMRDRS